MSRHSPPALQRPLRHGVAPTFLLIIAMVAIVLALVLHGVQLLSLGPWAAQWPRAAVWPAGFQAWVAESVAIALAAGALLGYFQAERWHRWVDGLTGPQRAAWLTIGLLAAQVVLGAAFWLTRHHGVETLGGLRAVFHLGGEFRLPTFFATAQAVLAAWLAWQVYRNEQLRVWSVVAGICLYIGVDELLSIHEFVGRSLRRSNWIELDTLSTVALPGGVHVYSWQIVFLPIAITVGLWLLSRLWRVADARTLALLTLAAVLFVGGSIGFETVQATASVTVADWHESEARHWNLLFEETLETLGMTVAVYVFADRAWSASGRANDKMQTA